MTDRPTPHSTHSTSHPPDGPSRTPGDHTPPISPVAPTRPTGRPLASLPMPSSTAINDPTSHTWVANDGAHPGTTVPDRPASQRISRQQLTRLRERLSERDWLVVADVDQFRFLTAKHVRAVRFDDHASDEAAARATRRTLARLSDWRIIAALPRRIGGMRSGSAGLVYYVDVIGDRLLRERQPDRARRRFLDPSVRFLSHTLAVADTVTDLLHPGDTERWCLHHFELEPTAWRQHHDLGGATFTLKPDLYLETAPSAQSDDVTAYFVEIDLGAESLPTLLRKCHTYEQYRRTGTEQTQYGSFPQVIWSITARTRVIAERRRRALIDAIHHDPQLPDALFLVTDPSDLTTLISNGGTP